MDEIRIDGLKCYAYHGVYDEEKEKGQYFFINAVLYTDTRAAGKTDDLELSTDYGAVCHFMNDWMKQNVCNLLEMVAENLAREILLRFPLINSLDLEIQKPQAPIGLPFENVSVKISRGWHTVYLSVGSNMGNKEKYISDGINELSQDDNIEVLRCSELLITKPYGGVEQEDFVNGAIKIRTLYTAKELLSVLHEIEAKACRERIVRWGPRTLDLDIVFYDKMVYEDEELIVPHVDMENRYFVLKPLSELAPNFRHPLLNKTVEQMLRQLGDAE